MYVSGKWVNWSQNKTLFYYDVKIKSHDNKTKALSIMGIRHVHRLNIEIRLALI